MPAKKDGRQNRTGRRKKRPPTVATAAAVAAPPPPSTCAPSRFPDFQRTGTCLAREDLLDVARALGIFVPPRAPPSSVLGTLHRALGTEPGQEGRWASLAAPLAPLSRRLAAAFRPPQPPHWQQEPHAWLSNTEIESVMRQYEDAFGERRGFRFLGVSPIDFAKPAGPGGSCVTPSLCGLDARRLLAAGRPQFAAVLNLDPHTRGGSHWVSLYGGVDPARAERFGVWYYDSIARPPPPEVLAFTSGLRAQVAEVHGPAAARAFRVQHNAVRRQYRNTECGLFAMLFVVACVATSRPVAEITRAIRRDASVQRLRGVFFRPPPT